MKDLTPRAKKVIEIADQVATELGDQFTGVDAICIALIRFNKGVAANVLAKHGITEDVIMADLVPSSHASVLFNFHRNLAKAMTELESLRQTRWHLLTREDFDAQIAALEKALNDCTNWLNKTAKKS